MPFIWLILNDAMEELVITTICSPTAYQKHIKNEKKKV